MDPTLVKSTELIIPSDSVLLFADDNYVVTHNLTDLQVFDLLGNQLAKYTKEPGAKFKFFNKGVIVGNLLKEHQVYLYIFDIISGQETKIEYNELFETENNYDREFGTQNNIRLLGFQNRYIFVAEVLDAVPTRPVNVFSVIDFNLLIKQISIDTFEVTDINYVTVTLRNLRDTKVFLSNRGEPLFYSNCNNELSIVPLTRPDDVIFYLESTFGYSDLPTNVTNPIIINRPLKDMVLFNGENLHGNPTIYYTILGEDGIFPIKCVDSEGVEIPVDKMVSAYEYSNDLIVLTQTTDFPQGNISFDILIQHLPIYRQLKSAYN